MLEATARLGDAFRPQRSPQTFGCGIGEASQKRRDAWRTNRAENRSLLSAHRLQTKKRAKKKVLLGFFETCLFLSNCFGLHLPTVKVSRLENGREHSEKEILLIYFYLFWFFSVLGELCLQNIVFWIFSFFERVRKKRNILVRDFFFYPRAPSFSLSLPPFCPFFFVPRCLLCFVLGSWGTFGFSFPGVVYLER